MTHLAFVCSDPDDPAPGAWNRNASNDASTRIPSDIVTRGVRGRAPASKPIRFSDLRESRPDGSEPLAETVSQARLDPCVRNGPAARG